MSSEIRTIDTQCKVRARIASPKSRHFFSWRAAPTINEDNGAFVWGEHARPRAFARGSAPSARQHERAVGRAVAMFQLKGWPTQPGRVLPSSAAAPSSGSGTKSHAFRLEYINGNTWQAGLALEESAGKQLTRKYNAHVKSESARGASRGSSTQNAVSSPELCTSTVPPCARAIRSTMCKPSPTLPLAALTFRPRRNA
jgi:hypothetical protein